MSSYTYNVFMDVPDVFKFLEEFSSHCEARIGWVIQSTMGRGVLVVLILLIAFL